MKTYIFCHTLLRYALLMSLFSARAALATVDLPFAEDFEALGAGALAGQNRWEVLSGTAEVQSAVARSGQQAVRLETGHIARAVRSAGHLLWLRFYVRLEGSPQGAPHLDENSNVSFYINSSRQIVVFNGTNAQVLTEHVLPIGQWVRFDVFSDYENRRWLLGVNGSTVASNLAFYDDNFDQFDSAYLNSGGTTVYVDDINLDDVEPVYTRDLDADGDSLPDWWEQRFFNGITQADPNELSASGVPLRDSYIAGLTPTDPESRFDAGFNVADRTLQWDMQIGRLYDVYWTDSLTRAEGWERIVENHSQSTFSDDDPDRTNSPVGFYKLRVRLP